MVVVDDYECNGCSLLMNELLFVVVVVVVVGCENVTIATNKFVILFTISGDSGPSESSPGITGNLSGPSSRTALRTKNLMECKCVHSKFSLSRPLIYYILYHKADLIFHEMGFVHIPRDHEYWSHL